ncbi:hypothetical protein MAUB1S_00763 [Mycolicibacterium aubagnense]
MFTLTYDAADVTAPSSLVAKVPATDADSRAAALGQRLYEREVRFYQELHGRTLVVAPTHIYSDIDTTTGHFVLLLEDLVAHILSRPAGRFHRRACSTRNGGGGGAARTILGRRQT